MPLPWTIAELSEAVTNGACSAVEAVRDCFSRIDRLEGELHAFISHDGDRAMSRAKAIDAAVAAGSSSGLLAGVPIAVKDNICVSAGTTTCGSRMLENFQATYNAHIIDRLEAAGAVIIGKTNMDEFGMGSSTEYGAFGGTGNPWASDRVPGGSSGGSAAAVAAGLVPAAIGSDTGGSIRQPAAFCGVVGLKPSYGLVSRYGLVAYGSSLDQIGTITANVRDAAILLNAIAGHDPRDSTSVNATVPDYASQLNVDVKGKRIGVSEAFFTQGLDAGVRGAVQEAIARLEHLRAKLVPIELPHLKYAIAAYYLIATAEASSNLARYDGVHYGRRSAQPRDMADLYADSRGEGLGPEVKRRIMLGTHALSSGYYDAYYLKASKVRTLIKRDFERAFEKIDVIASPVTPTTAFRMGEKLDDPLAMYLSDIYTVPANLAGLCAISVPCGFDDHGLPIGLQLSAAPFNEDRLLSVAHAYEANSELQPRTPPLFAGTG